MFEDNSVLTFPHLAGVTISDDGRLGSSSCIDRASLTNTIIKDHAKIGNPAHNFHNIVRGRLAKITVMMIIAAGKKNAKNAWNTQSVTLRG